MPFETITLADGHIVLSLLSLRQYSQVQSVSCITLWQRISIGTSTRSFCIAYLTIESIQFAVANSNIFYRIT